MFSNSCRFSCLSSCTLDTKLFLQGIDKLQTLWQFGQVHNMNNGGASRSTPSTSSANSRLKKTTNKSGLTPVRFTDSSPGNALKLKSGLTPVRPDRPVYNPSKSPFRSPGSGLKLKSGLTPIRPELSHIQSKSPFNRQGLQPKLKSGLLPIKPQSSSRC